MKSNNFSADMGYGGFNRFRNKVATLSHSEFGKHYAELNEPTYFMGDDERDSFYKKHDTKTMQLINSNKTTTGIANFCYQSDCDGSIDQNQAKQIYEKIKNYDDDICYGYAGREDCAMFSHLKNIFRDCAENGGEIRWW